MAILTVSSNVRLNPGFEDKIQRDLEKIEGLAPRNTILRVFLKRTEAGLFETEMESSVFSKKLFSKARASNAFAAFKRCKEIFIKQIRRQVTKTRDLHTQSARDKKRTLASAAERLNLELEPAGS